MVTLRDIASVASVSQTTVSKVLNGKYREVGITLDCATRVKAVAEQMGYRPNRAARATASGRFGTIALLKVQSNIGLGQLPEGLLNGIEIQAGKLGLQMSFCSVKADFDQPGRMPRILKEAWADGFLLFGDWESTDRLAAMVRRLNLPLVAVGVKEQYDCIYADESDAAQQATRLMIAAGHRKIGRLVDPRLPRYALMARQAGYEATMRQAGLTPLTLELPGEHRRVEVRSWQAAAAQRTTFLQDPDRPTAVIVDTVEVAYPLLDEARHLGIAVPKNLAMITFHDVAASALGLCINTMLLRCSELGSDAMNMLQTRIAEGEPLPAATVKYQYMGGHTV